MVVGVTDGFDVDAIRAQFPAFERSINGAPLVYLDSASTTQKPRAVIDAVTRAMSATANIHRGVHTLSVEATDAYEAVRGKVARLLGADDDREIVFVRGTTEAVNLLARSLGPLRVREGDDVIVTRLEHHSNLVPWQALCAERRANLLALPIDDRGEVRIEKLDAMLSERTRIVAIAHVSNSLGTVVPVAEIARRAKAFGAIVIVDGAQAIAHRPVDVRALGCDFYAFSAHKMYGPTGAGALWGRREIFEEMGPFQHGGDMVEAVSFDGTTFREPPHRFEAGTPDIVGVIGMGAAIDWLSAIGMERIAAREAAIHGYLVSALEAVRGVRAIGTARERATVASFLLGDLHPHDVGTALDLQGIAVRTGQHCAQPVMDHFEIGATIRASLGVYSTEADVDRLVEGLAIARRTLGEE